VATALLVAGSTPTIWIPQAQFVSTIVFKRCSSANFRLVPINAHVTWRPRCSIDIEPWWPKTKTEHYYSAHNVATTVSFDT